MALAPRHDDLLLVVDLQYDFLPGGALAVAGGDEIVIPINRLGRRFENVGMTQDWHPRGHISFASSHEGTRPFEVMQLPYGPQVLWPDHCVWDTQGAEFSRDVELPHSQLVVRKGYHEVVDSYSGFQEADRRTKTGLEGYLRERGIRRLFIAGLATDFCVNWTAVDAAAAGFETYVIEDACRAIDTGGSLAQAWTDMNAAGVRRIAAGEIGVEAGMRRVMVAALAALAATAAAADDPPPAAARLLWCSSAFFWLASDAYNSGEDDEGQHYEAWSDQLLARGRALLEGSGLGAAKIDEIVDGYDQKALDQMGTPAAEYEVTACPELVESP